MELLILIACASFYICMASVSFFVNEKVDSFLLTDKVGFFIATFLWPVSLPPVLIYHFLDKKFS